MAQFTERHQQDLETLAGTRNVGITGQAAVRVADLDGLLQIPDTLKSQKVTSSVSASDFNKLVDDVAMLHTRLRSVIVALRARRGR
jgi:hypothetical protein